jgi:hypothetical protein
MKLLQRQLGRELVLGAGADEYSLDEAVKLPDLVSSPASDPPPRAASTDRSRNGLVEACWSVEGPSTIPVCLLDATDAMLSQFSNSDGAGTMRVLLKRMPWLVSRKLSDKASASSLLHCAAARKAAGAVSMLLQAGADATDRRNHKKWTPLHSMAASAIESAPLGSDVATMDLLIAGGADIDASDNHGRTPLWLAAHFGRCALVQAMLHRGANAAVVAGKPRRRLLLACAEAFVGKDSPEACGERLRLLTARPEPAQSARPRAACGSVGADGDDCGFEADDDDEDDAASSDARVEIRRRCDAVIAAWEGECPADIKSHIVSIGMSES